ncbi:MAG: carboxypeptidase regulatory-like domain-containing protein [Sedimentisphaerales bacterium]|nr:carboxypeptidase regulatory-like domain-containing protein [Sedimentisphaerales bacterium]
MYIKKTLMLSMLFFVSVINLSNAKQVAFKGTVVDSKGNPVAGAKAKLYNEDYGREMYTFIVSDVIETTSNDEGTFSFEKDTEGDDYLYGWIVVDKAGLALDCVGWEMDNDMEFMFKLGQSKELDGVVVDENGNPLAEAQVSILILNIGEEKDSHGQHIRALSVNVASKVLNAETDNTGKFKFTNLPGDSKVEFLVKKEGKTTVDTFRIDTYPEESLQYSPGQDDIKIVLLPESVIEGVVIDKNTGKSVDGVNLLLRRGQNSRIFGQDIITSKEDGTFKINRLSSGGYNLIYAAPRDGLAEWIAPTVNITLEKGQIKNNVKVELSKGGLLEVLVTETGKNKSLEGATVLTYDERNSLSYAQKTDKEGIARIRLLPGEYESAQVFKDGYSSFRMQNSITIEEGRTKHLEWQLGSVPKASGVVRDENGKPVKGAKLCVLPGGGRDIESDDEGKFEISWDLEMFPDERENPLLVCRYEERNLAKVVILEENTENLEVKLEPGIAVTGKVTNPEGKGIREAGIRMMLRQDMWSSTFMRGDTTKTDEKGNFEVKAIPAEHRYEIIIKAEGYGSQRKEVHADDAVNKILDAGTFNLPVANLSVSGIVVDIEGNPIPDAKNESYNHEGGQPERLNTQADSNGKFVLKGVCEGRVDIRVNVTLNGKRLSARASADGGYSDIKIVVREKGEYVTQYFNNKTYEQILQDSEKVIAGVVVDDNDAPVSGVSVGVNCIKREQENAPGKFVWSYSSYENLTGVTDKQGRFAIELEEDAEYDLIFSPYNYAAVLVYDIPAGKKDIKVVLPKGGMISGQLVRMEGSKKKPIANVEVKLEQESRASYTHLGFDQDKTTITDSQGRFKFEHIQTKIRPRESMPQTEWEFVPRVWKVVFGDITKTFAFYESNIINDFEIVVDDKQSNPQKLTGKALPDFEGIKTEFNIEKVKEKKMLICFFDIEQRPSRNCILELSKKTQELKVKDIEVLLIHASKIEKEYIDKWSREYNVSFSVGMIETNEEQIRFNWGVKALPWLILTDKNHIVIAEGFSITELAENLETSNK